MTEQVRLFIAETLVRWAMRVAPVGHPDSIAIYEAAMHVARREPS